MADLEYGNTPDAIDRLIADLNEEMGDDLTFERDVLDVDRPEDWGAVELTGVFNEYADGKVIDQTYKVDVWASVSTRESGWLQRIEGVLRSYGDHLGFYLKERAYLHDLEKILWRWECQLWSLEAPEEPEPDPEEEPDNSGTNTGDSGTNTDDSGTNTGDSGTNPEDPEEGGT